MKSICHALLATMALGTLVLQFPAGQSAYGQEKTAYCFCSQTNCTDGATPWATLIDVNGTLYGTTSDGGSTGCTGYGCSGTVFSLDLSTATETVLYSFCSQAKCTDGASPVASLIEVNGILYGTTYLGGGTGCDNYGCGTAFSLDPGTGAETVPHSLCSQAARNKGGPPLAGLIDVHGKLYGTTLGGGQNSLGTVFSLDPDTGREKVVYSFCSQTNCTDGEAPYSSLIDVKGTLYGTTSAGGTGCSYPYCGTVFSLDPKTGTETVLHSFCSLTNCSDGQEPVAGLIEEQGVLYGTTEWGGAYGGGTVFSLDIGTGAETVLYSFCRHGAHCKDGQSPESGLLKVEGRLYGTTFTGGTRTTECLFGTCGIVFWVKTP
jgi:uncharacterized repeat protein (TIGR03803 family)